MFFRVCSPCSCRDSGINRDRSRDPGPVRVRVNPKTKFPLNERSSRRNLPHLRPNRPFVPTSSSPSWLQHESWDPSDSALAFFLFYFPSGTSRGALSDFRPLPSCCSGLEVNTEACGESVGPTAVRPCQRDELLLRLPLIRPAP